MPTVAEYLAANADKKCLELTPGEIAIVKALRGEDADGGDESEVASLPVDNISSGLPYGATRYVVAYYGATNNIHTITYYDGATVLATRTLAYAAGGAADNDKLTESADS